jgi:hypothetical protein
MGSVKREIVFLGDTVNTAARIQELCRETGERVLASADLIDHLELPPGVAKRSLGDLRLRGKGADLALYALTKAPLRASGSRPAPSGPTFRTNSATTDRPLDVMDLSQWPPGTICREESERACRRGTR